MLEELTTLPSRLERGYRFPIPLVLDVFGDSNLGASVLRPPTQIFDYASVRAKSTSSGLSNVVKIITLLIDI